MRCVIDGRWSSVCCAPHGLESGSEDAVTRRNPQRESKLAADSPAGESTTTADMDRSAKSSNRFRPLESPGRHRRRARAGTGAGVRPERPWTRWASRLPRHRTTVSQARTAGVRRGDSPPAASNHETAQHVSGPQALAPGCPNDFAMLAARSKASERLRTAASGRSPLQLCAASADSKKFTWTQKLCLTSVLFASGATTETTAVEGLAASIPSGDTVTETGCPVAAHGELTSAVRPSTTGKMRASSAHQVNNRFPSRSNR